MPIALNLAIVLTGCFHSFSLVNPPICFSYFPGSCSLVHLHIFICTGDCFAGFLVCVPSRLSHRWAGNLRCCVCILVVTGERPDAESPTAPTFKPPPTNRNNHRQDPSTLPKPALLGRNALGSPSNTIQKLSTQPNITISATQAVKKRLITTIPGHARPRSPLPQRRLPPPKPHYSTFRYSQMSSESSNLPLRRSGSATLAPPANEELTRRSMERSPSATMRAEKEDLKEAAEDSFNVILDLDLDGNIRWVSASWDTVIG